MAEQPKDKSQGERLPPFRQTAVGLGDHGSYCVLLALSEEREELAFSKGFSLIGWTVESWDVDHYIPDTAVRAVDVVLTDSYRVLDSVLLVGPAECRPDIVMLVWPDRAAAAFGRGADRVITRPIDADDALGLRQTRW